MTSKPWVGIDPGLTGGVALIGVPVPFGLPMPTNGNRVDGGALTDILLGFGAVAGCVIEEQSFRPNEGKNRIATTFTNMGIQIGVLQALGIAVHITPPKTWKTHVLGTTWRLAAAKYLANTKYANDAKKREKTAAILFTQYYYPTIDLTPGSSRKPQDGLADATAIAHYGAHYV